MTYKNDDDTNIKMYACLVFYCEKLISKLIWASTINWRTIFQNVHPWLHKCCEEHG